MQVAFQIFLLTGGPGRDGPGGDFGQAGVFLPPGAAAVSDLCQMEMGKAIHAVLPKNARSRFPHRKTGIKRV